MPEAFTFLIKFIPEYFILVLSMYVVYFSCLNPLKRGFFHSCWSIGIYSLYTRQGYIRIFSYQYRVYFEHFPSVLLYLHSPCFSSPSSVPRVPVYILNTQMEHVAGCLGVWYGCVSESEGLPPNQPSVTNYSACVFLETPLVTFWKSWSAALFSTLASSFPPFLLKKMCWYIKLAGWSVSN